MLIIKLKLTIRHKKVENSLTLILILKKKRNKENKLIKHILHPHMGISKYDLQIKQLITELKHLLLFHDLPGGDTPT